MSERANHPVRVFIADDQPLMRQGFRMILSSQPGIEVVGEAADGLAALEGVERTHPDVVLMDIRMPGLDGIEATKQICGARVLILTTFGHDEYVVEALRAGASGFLLKDATPEELVHAVRVVADGGSLLAPAVTTTLLARVLPTLGQAPGDGPPVPNRLSQEVLAQLTDRELEVLKLVAKGRSNAEIATDLYISEATVKTHVSHLLNKLALRDRVQAVVLAFEAGLVRPTGP
ncbi:MAG TPA: response regulator transcription factor [Acidimicrobiales bacterium]|nr:response regulator transcription factor [Acidimicrobiales bacterium]